MLHNSPTYSLTIANGGTSSASLGSLMSAGQLKLLLGNTAFITIYAPATLAEACSVYISPVESPAAGDWVQATQSGSPFTLAAGASVSVPIAGLRDLKIVAGGAVAAARTFKLLSQVVTD